MNMPEPITCERVDREELDLQYVRGTLAEPEAEAFEEHYWGCDRCWALVRGGNEVRAVRPTGGTRRWPRSRTLALAAVLVGAAGLGFWRLAPRTEPAVSAPSLERGGTAASIALSAALADRRLLAHWTGVPGAASYRVRFFSADGSVLLTRVNRDTLIVVPQDSLRVPAGGAVLWQVQALDRLGAEVMRSKLVEVPGSGER